MKVICKKCGAEVMDNAVYCPKCGENRKNIIKKQR
ncbi:zinc-ribbon domain-containing protein [Clostridium sp. AF17-2]|nr:zinc-ribbon domain-containing protein [Clostridium sp. AF23-6LB]RGG76014.1 zinc-ribbon domain-containing protein [Clostridium sp. AF17-21AC]RHR55479.1 zinc-ribbon domain-containing protein [Clostridium sp. AF17-2]RHS52141.1 zinc-ribbon domain-containing protein [Clostridium sp. AM46-21]